ncbi:hypothetical protein DNTS_013976, partial [Danionella cerebrum]
LKVVPDEAGEESVPSSGEQGRSSGDQESLFLLLKQKMSLSQDHLGSREVPDDAGDESVLSSGE